jgi:outer membrane protein
VQLPGGPDGLLVWNERESIDMRALVIAAALVHVLGGAPAFAQAPTQPPAPTPPAAPPAPTPPAAPAPQPPRPFPQGAKVAFINIQRIANDSAEGKAATAKVQALAQKKSSEIQDKSKQLQAADQKLKQGATVLSEAARGQLEKEIERLNVDIERLKQDANAEVTDLQQELQAEFQRKLMPIIAKVAESKDLLMVFSQLDSGLVWADFGVDITEDVIKQFDTGNTATSPPAKPSTDAPPAATPPAKPPQQ